jgi:hypothetical protein
VCSYIVRRTFGWKKASDRISLEQICRGIVRRDGSRLDHGTQLDRKTAIKALRGLETKGVIVAQRNYSEARGFEATSYGLRFRGQPPTRTLVEKLPQGDEGPGDNLHQGPGDAIHQPPGEDLHQASGAIPPAPVASGHPQPTSGPSNNQTSGQVSKGKHQTRGRARAPGANGEEAGASRSVPAAAEQDSASAAAPVAGGQDGALMPRPATGGRDSVSAAGGQDGASAAALAVGENGATEGAVVSAPLPGMERSTSEADAAIWGTVLARLEQQMTAANYQTWLADTRPLGRRGATLVVGAPSGFVRDWLQTRFRALVRRALQEAAPSLSDVTFATYGGGSPG